ncbi:MAG TPA: polyprenol monophosphomannose synthase [Patescibacteria group bacterium]|nr:polyprenol monophosphomannose synthase [Patescibacteria group bacterium]
MQVAIVTPTYNEAGNIEKLISQIAGVCKKIPGVNFMLLVADDNSPDGTAKLADNIGQKLKSKDFTVRILVRKKKDGIGKAYINAFNVLLKENFDFIIQIDADLQHNPIYIKDLVAEAQKGRDFVAASRYMKGGKIEGWGLHRKILSRGGNIYTRIFLGSGLTDYTNGLNLFSVDLLKKIDVNSLNSAGYGFFIELKYKALRLSKNYVQIPITLYGRQHGQSKISKNIIFLNLALVPKLRFSSSNK